jgi:hypothetical protein
MQTKLLVIYLNDHLAGATAGAAVAQRAAGSNLNNVFCAAFPLDPNG